RSQAPCLEKFSFAPWIWAERWPSLRMDRYPHDQVFPLWRERTRSSYDPDSLRRSCGVRVDRGTGSCVARGIHRSHAGAADRVRARLFGPVYTLFRLPPMRMRTFRSSFTRLSKTDCSGAFPG